MAPYLLVCMNCGLYLKGQPAEVQEICAQHMCDPFTTKMRKSVIECKAILDTLAADGQIDMDIDSSNNSSSIIGINDVISSPAAMAQSHLPRSPNQKDDDCETKKRQNHSIAFTENQTPTSWIPITSALTSQSLRTVTIPSAPSMPKRMTTTSALATQSSRAVTIPPAPPMPKCMPTTSALASQSSRVVRIPPAPPMPNCMAEKKRRKL